MNRRTADEGYAARNGCSDAESPVGILIETKYLARKCHAECHQQQEHAKNPGQLSRELICTEEEDLRHVNQHNGDHKVRSPTMHRAQEPAKSQLVIKNVQAVPC